MSSQARRFHGPGVGGRTGMTVGEDVQSMSGYYDAGRRAMDASRDQTEYPDDDEDEDGDSTSRQVYSDEESQEVPAGRVSSSSSKRTASMGRKSGLGSSSMTMDIDNSE